MVIVRQSVRGLPQHSCKKCGEIEATEKHSLCCPIYRLLIAKLPELPTILPVDYKRQFQKYPSMIECGDDNATKRCESLSGWGTQGCYDESRLIMI